MIYATADGDPIYSDNGLSLYKVQYPEQVQGPSVITADFMIGKKEIFPLKNRCMVDGKAVKVIALVDNQKMTEKTLCVNNSNMVGAWNKSIDIPVPAEKTRVRDVSLYFVQPNDGANQFGSSWKNMPESTITFQTQYLSGQDDGSGDGTTTPDDGNNNGGNNNDGSNDNGSPINGRTMLIGLLGAGMYARHKRGKS